MPFQKGHQLWKKGLAVRREKADKIDMFLLTLAGNGMDKYAEIMDKLVSGEEMTKAEEQYMDRLEGWREYVKPKLARQELTGKDGEEFKGVQIYLPQKNGVEATPKTGDSPTK